MPVREARGRSRTSEPGHRSIGVGLPVWYRARLRHGAIPAGGFDGTRSSRARAVPLGKASNPSAPRRGLIEWTPALHQLFAERALLERRARDSKSAIPESMFLFTNRDGQPYTEQGGKAL